MGLAWGSGFTLTGNKRVTWLTAASDDGRWGHIQWPLTHTQQAWTRYNSWHYKHGSWSSTRDHTHPRAARLRAQSSHHKHPLLPIQRPGCSQTTSTPCGLPGLCSFRLFKTDGRQRDIGSWMLQEHGSSSRKTKRDERTLTFYLSDLKRPCFIWPTPKVYLPFASTRMLRMDGRERGAALHKQRFWHEKTGTMSMARIDKKRQDIADRDPITTILNLHRGVDVGRQKSNRWRGKTLYLGTPLLFKKKHQQ